MKRFVALGLVAGLVLGALSTPATAKKKKKKRPKRVERTVEHAYQLPSPGIPGVVGICLAAAGVSESACIDIPTGNDDRYVSVDVTDTSGQTPYGILAQDSDQASPGLEIFAEFCGKTESPVAITPGLPLRVSLYAGPAPNCMGVATSGTITAKLSNLP
jgi:hypothetical protein